jgi:hypothetical protein
VSTTFVLIDETNGATTGDGASLTPEIFSRIASAVQVQLNRDAAGELEAGPFLVRIGAAADVQPDEVPFPIKATIGAPGAIADHYVNANGVPACEDAITLSDSLTGPGNSLSVAISHECLETGGDPGANEWADRGDSYEVAKERCDAVESQTYDIGAAAEPPVTTGVHVSNFVTNRFFIPGASGPIDFMTSRGIPGAVPPPGPMQTAPGGGGNYQAIRWVDENGVTQVTAEGNPNGRRPWRHGSRRARRGVAG